MLPERFIGVTEVWNKLAWLLNQFTFHGLEYMIYWHWGFPQILFTPTLKKLFPRSQRPMLVGQGSSVKTAKRWTCLLALWACRGCAGGRGKREELWSTAGPQSVSPSGFCNLETCKGNGGKICDSCVNRLLFPPPQELLNVYGVQISLQGNFNASEQEEKSSFFRSTIFFAP